MARPTKVDYAELKQLYLSEELSFRQLGERFGISHSAIADRAKREDWEGQRMAFKASMAQREYESLAVVKSSETAQVLSENILIARAYLRRFAQDLKDGKIATNAKDAHLMITFLSETVSPAKGEGSPDAPKVIEGTVLPAGGAEFLRRVVEVARGRVAAPGNLGADPLVESPRTRPN
jgi:predicted DNA-binding protein YlxM (UPF0122 family)